MSRWLILLGSFGLWLFCIGTLYVNFRPQEEKDVSPAARASLDRLFAEDTEDKRAWRIFINVDRLKQSKLIPLAGFRSGHDSTLAAAPIKSIAVTWEGFDETGLTEVGSWVTETKRKFETRLTQTGTLHVNIPEDVDFPPPASFKFIELKHWADISMDEGLKTCSAVVTIGNILEANALGVREGTTLKMTSNVSLRNQPLLTNTVNVPIGYKSAPETDPMPFQSNRDVKEGATWEVALIGVDLSGGGKPQATSMKLRCTGKTQIMLDSNEVTVYVVTNEDGSARAWYSADGVVLKQAYRLAGIIDLMAVRQETKKSQKARKSSDTEKRR